LHDAVIILVRGVARALFRDGVNANLRAGGETSQGRQGDDEVFHNSAGFETCIGWRKLSILANRGVIQAGGQFHELLGY
jgi:hypothetical protein